MSGSRSSEPGFAYRSSPHFRPSSGTSASAYSSGDSGSSGSPSSGAQTATSRRPSGNVDQVHGLLRRRTTTLLGPNEGEAHSDFRPLSMAEAMSPEELEREYERRFDSGERNFIGDSESRRRMRGATRPATPERGKDSSCCPCSIQGGRRTRRKKTRKRRRRRRRRTRKSKRR